MQEVTIWHNPKCSKSRNALALLEENNIEANVVKYLENTPTKEEIKNILNLLEMNAKDLLRKGESAYSELNLSQIDDEDALIQAMVENPILIERPIIVKSNKAVIARPIENLEDLLK
ncbi:arsenate reductase (glutaredoxin) [Poseidonibacter sp.]|uniref:arsenate reductase (glutaredoxin) n=1 Tax=Poseidonibacter sp. TaxID=2321188 RepID=UPI003C7587EC